MGGDPAHQLHTPRPDHRTTGQPSTCLTTRKDVAVFPPDRHDLPLDSFEEGFSLMQSRDEVVGKVILRPRG